MDNRYLGVLIGSVLGSVLTLVVQYIRNKRGLFTYFVRHERVGLSADDAVFGTVRVTWNGNPVANLYSSTIELRNESLQDYEDVVVAVYTSGTTTLLTESSQIVNTIQFLKWTTEYETRQAVPPGGQPTEEQWSLHGRRREYRIATMNRGQVVRLVYLNSATAETGPTLWLDILHKGVRLKYRAAYVAQTELLGVPAPAASCAGLVLGIGFFAAVTWSIDILWVGAGLCLAFGFMAPMPGALLIRLWRWLRNVIGG